MVSLSDPVSEKMLCFYDCSKDFVQLNPITKWKEQFHSIRRVLVSHSENKMYVEFQEAEEIIKFKKEFLSENAYNFNGEQIKVRSVGEKEM